MKRLTKFLPALGAIVAVATLPTPLVSASPGTGGAAAHWSHHSAPGPTLVGRAILDATVTAAGPPSGARLVPDGQQTTVINGIEFPRPAQPVIGFSAVLDGRRHGEYLVMPDNGYGGKANSADFLIRAYYLAPDFKTARRGSGDVEVRDFIQFRDPKHLLPFTIVNDATSDRLLTGGDIDPESMQRGRHGDLWMGDEFGPWILHFDRHGVLVDPPFEMPGLMSPNHPDLPVGTPATQPNSRGFEAMSITPDGKYLYAVLEGPTVADGPTSVRRRVFEFDTRAEELTGREWNYRTETATNMVADAWALDRHRMVVIERDGGLGLNALFRTVYVVDLRQVGTDGYVAKRAVVDLAAIPDPKLISLPERHPGDVGLGNPFRVTCESIEAIHVLDGSRLLLGCDNNLPNTGRNPGRADDSEFIVVEVPGLRRPW